jgi:hypothetical protein
LSLETIRAELDWWYFSPNCTVILVFIFIFNKAQLVDLCRCVDEDNYKGLKQIKYLSILIIGRRGYELENLKVIGR